MTLDLEMICIFTNIWSMRCRVYINEIFIVTRQSKQCGFSIYIFDNSKSKSMVRLVRSEKKERKIARMVLIQNI